MFTSEVRIRDAGGVPVLFVVTNAGARACAEALARAGLGPLVEAVRAFADPVRMAGGNGFEVRLRPGTDPAQLRTLVARLIEGSNGQGGDDPPG
jgi:phosphoglycolate phosphatase-like HAD superfamily hydrolase